MREKEDMGWPPEMLQQERWKEGEGCIDNMPLPAFETLPALYLPLLV